MRSLVHHLHVKLASPRLLAVLLSTLLLLASPVGAAQGKKQARIWDSILGVRLGLTRDEARERLKPFVSPAGDAREEPGGAGDAPGARGSNKETWALKKTEFAYVHFKLNRDGRVVGVSGFVRPGREIPFGKLGELERASSRTDSRVIWNVEAPDGPYRLVANGRAGRASVVSLLSLSLPPMQ